MIEKRTVFILGAGASCPYGFPTADELRTAILTGLSGWYGVLVDREARLAREGYPAIPAVTEFLSEFRGSNTDSVDLFLSRWPKFRIIGKLAILLGILQKEKSSRSDDGVKNAGQDWYFYLYKRLAGDLIGRDSYQQFEGNKIAFVTFNYDRSLEHFLFESLLHSFEGADAQTVKALIDGIPIIHVYGKLAPLPWQESDASNAVAYGDCDFLSSRNGLGLAENLFVLHEERINPALEKAQKCIREAERVFFLGFGYAKENLEVLGLPGVLRPTQLVYGTVKRFIPKHITDMQLHLAEGLRYSQKPTEDTRSKVHLKDCDCAALLREFL